MTKETIPSAAPGLEALEPYTSARMLNGFRAGGTYLDANELPFTPLPTELKQDGLQHYAYSGPQALHEAYADYTGVGTERLMATRGIDEGIDLLIRAYCEPHKDSIAIFSPTYGMYAVAAAIHRTKVVDLPLLSGRVEVKDLAGLKPFPKIVFVCRPNNPTGELIPLDDVRAILRAASGRALVAVDEAYIEFCPNETTIGLLQDFDNLVVMRTMSKAFGLAGIHLGFTIAHPSVIQALEKISNPYPIPEPCAQIATHALSSDGIQRLRMNVDEVVKTRDSFAIFLTQHQNCQRMIPSVTNFILSQWKNESEVISLLSEQQIFARPIAGLEGQGWIRFSIGSGDEMTRVRNTLTASR